MASSDKILNWLIRVSRLKRLEKEDASKHNFVLFDTLARILVRIDRLESLLLLNQSSASSSSSSTSKSSNHADDMYAADELKRALGAHKWSIRSEEHDCHELFHVIMDALEEEENEYKSYVRSLNFFTSSAESESASASASSQTTAKESATTSYLRNPFQGFTATQLECLSCGYKVSVSI